MKKQSKIFYINNDNDLSNAMQVLSKLNLSDDKHYAMTISNDKESRSLKQNRLAFEWYSVLGAMTGNGKEYERSRCKLMYGISILRQADADFNLFYMQSLINLTYEQKMAAMEYVPVTRLMTTKQFAVYLTNIDEASAQDGWVLPHPGDLYHESLMLRP